jgi:osmotically-inducible protein OsmY
MKQHSLLALGIAGVLAVAGCAGTSEDGNKESAGHYIDDATLTAKVKTAIASDAGVKAAANVNVETNQGVVQLSGFADSKDQATRAVAAARKVGGVRDVKDDIRVKN